MEKSLTLLHSTDCVVQTIVFWAATESSLQTLVHSVSQPCLLQNQFSQGFKCLNWSRVDQQGHALTIPTTREMKQRQQTAFSLSSFDSKNRVVFWPVSLRIRICHWKLHWEEDFFCIPGTLMRPGSHCATEHGGETSKVCFSPRFNNLTSCPRGEDLAYQLNLGWANVFPALWKQPVVDALVHPRPYKTQRAKLALNSKNGLTCNTGELKESNGLIKRHFHCTNTKPQCFLGPLKDGRAFKR